MDNYIKIIKDLSVDERYFNWYKQIIIKANIRSDTKLISRKKAMLYIGKYVEEHHIVPRSFSSSSAKDKNNLVYLTAREHFVVHKILAKLFKNPSREYFKMQEALSYFSNNSNRNLYFSSRDIATLREANSIASSERNKGNQYYKNRKPESIELKELRSQNAKKSKWVNNSIIEKFTSDFILCIENGYSLGRLKFSEKHISSIKSNSSFKKGIKRPKEIGLKISNGLKAISKKECPYCKDFYTPANYGRWHGDKCKSLNIIS